MNLLVCVKKLRIIKMFKLYLLIILFTSCTKISPTLPKIVTYKKDIRPLVETKCATCHNESTPERNWLNYKTIYDKRERVRFRVLVVRDMPQGYAMTEYERLLVGKWVDQGSKE